jgi:hypothetical protein
MLYKLEKPKVTPRKFLPYLGRTMGLEDDRISLYKPTNIALVMEDKELYVNKDELMELSPVFRKMLSKDFVEKDLTKIKLPGKHIEAFSCFLRCLLPGIAEQITGIKVRGIFYISTVIVD